MSHFLATDENPEGYKLEDILMLIRNDILARAVKISDDKRAEAQHVMRNNMKILNLLSDTIALAEDSTRVLDKSFGPRSGEKPRIGG